MGDVMRIGMDTSKSVFVLHGVDSAGEVVLRKQLKRGQVLDFFKKLKPTEVGLEACGGSHYWGREIAALGHKAKLLPPQHCKPYVGRNKNDAADAAGVCEAMSRPRLKDCFVPIKSADQQADAMLIGLRDRLIARRTQLSNMIRGHALEFGICVSKGLQQIAPLLTRIAANKDEQVPELGREMFAELGEEYRELSHRLERIEAKLKAWRKDNALCRRLMEVPIIGEVGAAMLAIKVPDAKAFRSGRDFAAWLGLTPKDHSTAGKQRHGGITRAGDESLRRVLVSGAMALIQQVMKGHGKPASPWLADLLKRKPPMLVAVALANKQARIAWKLMASGQRYDPNHRATAAARRSAAPQEGCAPRRAAATQPVAQAAM